MSAEIPIAVPWQYGSQPVARDEVASIREAMGAVKKAAENVDALTTNANALVTDVRESTRPVLDFLKKYFTLPPK